MGLLKQSTARNRAFLLVASSDHLSGIAAAAPVVTLSKNGAAFAAAGGAVTDLGSGWYTIALTTTDTNTVGDLAFHVTGTGADPSDWLDEVSVRIADDLSAPATAQTITANQAVNVAQWNGANVVAPATAGIPRVAIEAAGDFVQAAADKVWSSAARTLTAFSTTLAQSVWDVLDANISVASSVGLRLKGLTFTTANKVDATIQAAADFAQGAADKVWSTATRALTDKIGFALSGAGVQAIWDALTSALTTVGSVGKRIADDLDTTVSSRSTYAGTDTSGTTTLLGRLTATRAGLLDNVDVATSSRLSAASYTAPDNADILLIKAKTDNLPTDPADESLLEAAIAAVTTPSAATVAAAVLAAAATTPIASDVKKVNAVTITGDGNATPWGP